MLRIEVVAPMFKIVSVERLFVINGKKVYVTFPYDQDKKTMSLVKNILSESHIKNSKNA